MEQTTKEQQELNIKLAKSRMRILQSQGFYGLLLMHLRFGLDDACDTAYTDGNCIAFSPTFLKRLSDREVDFVLLHEILHVVLQHCFRQNKEHHFLWNIAADIVVNSIIRHTYNNDDHAIMVDGEVSMHRAPNGKEGHLYTMEQVYEMLLQKMPKEQGNTNGNAPGGDSSGGNTDSDENNSSQNQKGTGNQQETSSPKQQGMKTVDDHSHWKEEEQSRANQKEWVGRILNAAEAAKSVGNLPAMIERLINAIKPGQIDWRTILQEFIQEEINDYSFMPPDRRFSDSPFFLPDYNETDEIVRNILFMVDTSASVTPDDLDQAYSEIRWGIEEFGGKLSGSLGFFDAEVYDPIPFDSIESLEKIRPRGGGGTCFKAIFEYVREKLSDDMPVSIVILTDGYADFGKDKDPCGIPILWLINNEEITPPYGRVARFKPNK